MAAIYDQQGVYIGDDGAPSLDQMKLELVKKNQPLSAQIPGYDRPIPQAQTKPDPLGAAAGNFTELATKFNPLMMAKSMREAAGIVTVPAVAAVKGVGESILTSPAGTYTSGKAPAYAEQVAKQFMEQNAPQTPMTQEFAGAIAPYMAELPAYLGHLSTGRPALTPNDLRVMGAEATRVGRQIKDIPTDFANAQSGLQKLDPITGQPTYGAKLQGVAESVGDIMAQREMQGLPPIPGLPASMQPMNPKLYAMRPEGSRLTSAVIPETSKVSPYSAVTRELVNEVVSDGTITPLQTLEEIQNKYLRQPNAEGARDAFFNFLKNKAVEMYPDAPSPGEALDAYKARFSNKETSAPHTLQMYNEFLQTPEGAAIAARVDMPTAEEVVARHEAAVNWLNSQFTNYINEKVGTPNEPGIKLASQGLTYAQRGDVMESAHTTDYELQRRREQAGMPALTDTDKALAAANTQLQTLQQQAIDAITAKREQEAIAKQLGYGAIDPNTGTVAEGMNLGRYEPFAQASRAADKATVALNKQRRVIDNLQLGAAYENAIDTAIKAQPAGELLQKIPYEERQFYPALQKTPKTENAYTASIRQLKNLGFDDMARKFYDDVMDGKIPLDKVPKMTVEKYIRSVAEPRVAKERAAQAEQAAYKDAVDKQFKASADAHIPNDKVFGNVGALEITDKFTPEEVTKLVSEDTTALDVCIGEGGVRRDLPNLWHPGTGNRQYVPIYNVATGERNPDAPSPRMRYINAVRDGSQMVSFRDTVTGEPVAIFDFNPSSRPGKYNIDFASGRANGKIKPEYTEGIKSYLNSREDSIHDVGPNLGENAGLFDRQRMANSSLANLIDMPISKFASYDLAGLPRFITRTDLRNYIEDLQNREPVEQAPAVLSQRPSESLESYVTGAIASSIANILDRVKLELEEAGEPNQTATAVAFFDDIQDYFNAYQTAQGPTRALELTNQRLYDLESEYANSHRITANIIAEGINDLMDDIHGYLDYARNRQAAEAARTRPRAIAVQGDRMPDMDTTELLLEYRDRLTPEQVQWLENFDDRWNGQEGSTDAGQQGLVDEFERWRSVNRLAPETAQRPDYLRMTHDAALDLSRQMGEDAGDELRSAFRAITEGSGIDPVRDTDAFITALRGAADVAARGSVETALNELADRMESEYMRDWEPEEAPAALAQQPFDFARLVDGIVDEVSQNANPGVGNRVETIAYRIAERVNPRVNPEGYAQALRQVRTDTDHVAVGPALRALADRIYMPAEEPAPRQPREADLANQRNDAMIQLENSLNDPELNPDDLRFLANGLSNPLDQTANSPWIALSETERREYAQALRQRANYIEFNPEDLAQSLANEVNMSVPDMLEIIQALNESMLDHEVLYNLPLSERGRAAQRTALELEQIIQNTQRARQQGRAAEPAAQNMRDAAEDLVNGLDDAYYADADSPRAAVRLIRQHLRALRRNGEMAYEQILGMASEAYEWSPELLAALEVELEALIERYQDRDDYANGGPVRGYQTGGSVKKPEVKTPWLFSVPTYSETVAYEMYPGQKGQDDQRDAARHMLAAGTLSRKYGPGVAEFLGKAHEFTTSPFQAVKTLFGGQMPADYGMDTHNNAVGAQLGQRAKSQAELEDLVQEAAERASRTQTQGQAFIKKANGGIVQQNPTTDQMRYALMMRRK